MYPMEIITGESQVEACKRFPTADRLQAKIEGATPLLQIHKIKNDARY
jgi:hypothetical protein